MRKKVKRNSMAANEKLRKEMRRSMMTEVIRKRKEEDKQGSIEFKQIRL